MAAKGLRRRARRPASPDRPLEGTRAAALRGPRLRRDRGWAGRVGRLGRRICHEIAADARQRHYSVDYSWIFFAHYVILKARPQSTAMLHGLLTLRTVERSQMPKTPICSIDGCTRLALGGRGWCKAHHKRWRRHGDPTKRVLSDTQELKRFVQYAIAYAGDECLLWPFGKNHEGRGLISYKDVKGRYVHRFVCKAVHGEPPSSLHEAAHSCGNGHLSCITPNHLRWATKLENIADMIKHGTSLKGTRHHKAKLTENDVIHIRSKAGVMTQDQLSYLFGVSRSQISHIVNRKNWTHVA